MKAATLIARFLLGLIFVVFGLNFWLQFIPIPKADGHAAAFLGAMFATGYLAVIKALEILGGLLIWTSRFTALGLVILGPIIVNIVLHDIFLVGSLNPIVIVSSVLSLFLLWSERKKFLPLIS